MERWHPFALPAPSDQQMEAMNEMLDEALRPWDKGRQQAVPEGAQLLATGCMTEGLSGGCEGD